MAQLKAGTTIDGYAVITVKGDLAVPIPDDPYDPVTWDGNFEAPTKNAIRDKIESLTTGGTNQVSKYNMVGDITINTGVFRWYPDRSITLSGVYLSAGVAPVGGDFVVDILMNGISIMGGIYPTISAGNYISSTLTINISMVTTDYLTINVTSANGAKDGLLSIIYN